MNHHKTNGMGSHLAVAVFALGLGLGSSLLAWEANALQSDKQKPTTIDADKMTYDEKANVNVFEGRVLLTRGSLVISGQKLTLTQKPDGSQHAVVTGEPAKFKQQRDSSTPDILMVKGEASRIVFDGKTNVVTLTGSAHIKKTDDDQITEEISGREIVYEQNTEYLSVKGSATGDSSGRVQAVIKPATQANTPSKAKP